MLRCTACNAAIKNGYICESCGYDESRNYEKYGTVQLIGHDEHSVLFLRQKRDDVRLETLIQSMLQPYQQMIQALEKRVAVLESECSGHPSQPAAKPAEINYVPAEGPKAVPEERGASIKRGDIITFGSYPYERDGTRRFIEWLVLNVKEGTALVISRYGLDAVCFHEKTERTDWESYTLRIWLNKTFYETAFTSEEQDRILYMNKYYMGADMKDKVFLLSIADAKKYFPSNVERVCLPTDYAVKQGVYRYSGKDSGCCWWLGEKDTAAAVTAFGDVMTKINRVRRFAVRPAMCIKLHP